MIGVVYNRFPEIAAKWPVILHNVVVQTTEIIQELAQNNAPVDTGFLRDSIYAVTSDGSTYGQAGTPPGDSYLLSEGPGVSDPYTGYVGVGASYGGYVELGTRYMSAQPFFYPALEEGRSRFEAALSAMESFL
jgi:HK97 gp10 family phage protein